MDNRKRRHAVNVEIAGSVPVRAGLEAHMFNPFRKKKSPEEALAQMAQQTEVEVSKAFEDPRLDTSLMNVKLALFGPPKAEFKPGDEIRQIKLGHRYGDKNLDNPVVFVRYLTDLEKALYNKDLTQGSASHLRLFDMVICYFIDKVDGEPVLYLAESFRYEAIK